MNTSPPAALPRTLDGRKALVRSHAGLATSRRLSAKLPPHREARQHRRHTPTLITDPVDHGLLVLQVPIR